MAEYTFGTHAKAIEQAEAVKSKVWGPASNRAGLLAGALIVVGPQAYTNVQPIIQPSARAPLVAAPVSRYFTAGPQLLDTTLQPVIDAPQQLRQGRLGAYGAVPPQTIDLTIQAYLEAPSPSRQGRLGAAIFAYPVDTSQLRANIWSSTLAAIIPNPIARYFSIPPQLIDLTLPARITGPLLNPQGFSVRSYVVNAPLIDLSLPAYIKAPQPAAQGVLGARHSAYPVDTTQIQPVLFASLRAFVPIPNPVAPFYALAPQLLDTTLQPQVWKPGLSRQGLLGARISAAPADTSQLAPQVWASLVQPPVASNPVAPYYSLPPQFADLTLQPVISRPRLSFQGRVPPMINAGQQTRDLTPPSQTYPTPVAAIVHGLTLRQHMFVPEQANTQPNPTQFYPAVGSFVYTIDGSPQYAITVAYGGVIVYCDGMGDYFTIPRFPAATTGPTGALLSVAPAAGTYTNYNPAGFGPTIDRLDVDTTAGDVTIVSLFGGGDDQHLNISNIGPNNLILGSGFRLPATPFNIPQDDAQGFIYYGGSVNQWCMA